MSFSKQRPSKKRMLEEAGSHTFPRESSGGGDASTSYGGSSSAYRRRSNKDGEAQRDAEASFSLISSTTTTSLVGDATAFICQQQVETLQAELEHERSMRLLDQKRGQRVQQRLEQRMEIADEEARHAVQALDDFREQSEKMTSQLRQSRNQALQELRRLQDRRGHGLGYDSSDGEHDNQGGDASELIFWKEKSAYMEKQVQMLREKDQSFRMEIDNLREQMRQKMEERKSLDSSDGGRKSTMEHAPPAVMKELNQVRIQVAEREREVRQLKRANEDLHKRNLECLKENEEARIAEQRLPQVKRELEKLSKELETAVAENQNWKTFGKALNEVLEDVEGMPKRSSMRQARQDDGVHPPELSKVVKFLDTTRQRTAEAERQKKSYENECKELKEGILPLEGKVREFQAKERQWSLEREEMEAKLDLVNRRVSSLQGQQANLQRENDSLREIIETFEKMAPSSQKASKFGAATKSPSTTKSDVTSQALEVSLASARDECKLIKEESDRLSKELEDASKAKVEVQKELERVKEKFGKLRDALHEERGKASLAEERANEAEALAGKGSFNPETTRVLHVQETPLTEALKEEVEVLKRQLEVFKKKEGSKQQLGADPDKLNQRLKENFKEQIARFREGVYMMTGFKVDMIPGAGLPTFRVRSVYAEQEDDHLMLKWPEGAADVSSLDILHTDFAKALTATPAYQYMTKFHSLPAFMASVQLSLFEKQTVLIS